MFFRHYTKTCRSYRVSFSGSLFKEATRTLPDNKEDGYYCFAFNIQADNRRKDLVRQVLSPYDKNLDRGIAHFRPSDEFVCKLRNLYRREISPSVLNIHWHKFSLYPDFSDDDNILVYDLLENIQDINPQVRIVQIVFGEDSKYFKARFMENGKFVYFNKIEIVGPGGVKILSSKKNKVSVYNIADIFQRNASVFTKVGQEKIVRTRVAVVGASGIGSGLLYQMARIGFQNVSIIDFDKIEASNCNRLYSVDTPKRAIGRYKAKFMAKKYRQFNSKAKAQYYIGRAEEAKVCGLLKNMDLIILAVDNDAIRAVVNSLCARYCKPMVNISTGIFMTNSGNKIDSAGTQIQWFIPREPDYPCLKCHGGMNQKQINQNLMSETKRKNRKKAGYISNTILSPEPQVMPLNGIGISMAMWQICCWITGIKKPEPWSYYDAMENRLINMQVKQRIDCSCCSLNEISVIALGEEIRKLRSKPYEEKIRL